MPPIIGTVLLIEDDEVQRTAVSKFLQNQGFHVLIAADGRAGLDLFQAHEAAIDVVLLDLNLPRLNGREVLSELQRMQPGLKVILTSASGPSIDLGGLQPWIFIQKPYPLSALVALLREACQARRE